MWFSNKQVWEPQSGVKGAVWWGSAAATLGAIDHVITNTGCRGRGVEDVGPLRTSPFTSYSDICRAHRKGLAHRGLTLP